MFAMKTNAPGSNARSVPCTWLRDEALPAKSCAKRLRSIGLSVAGESIEGHPCVLFAPANPEDGTAAATSALGSGEGRALRKFFFYRHALVPNALPAACRESAPSSAAIASMPASHWCSAACRHIFALEYQGMALPAARYLHSGAAGAIIQTGVPIAPAR